MATLILMCGLPGSGKTTHARQIAAQRRALRLTPDEWVESLYGNELTIEQLDAARDPVESVQWAVAQQVLILGVDVILDYGFWSRTEREKFRHQAAELGSGFEIVFCEVSWDELLQRIHTRNDRLPPHTFRIRPERLREWWDIFEPPTPEEVSLNQAVNDGETDER